MEIQNVTKDTFKYIFGKKSLKIPKRKSESVYRRRTDNTKEKQQSIKTTNKTKDRGTRSPLETL
jgi:hypothetical protein